MVKEKSHIEPTHGKFCTYIPSLPKPASTTRAFSELNRQPLSIKAKINTLIITYWHRLECEELRPVLLNLYLQCKTHKHSFYENISFELRLNRLGRIISDTHSYSRQYLNLCCYKILQTSLNKR